MSVYITIIRDNDPLYYQRKKLFKAAMNREWKKVLELYRDEEVQGQYITRANDTLLHVAISGAEEKIVLDLLHIVQLNSTEMCNILKLKNNAGDTPLHLAAALGLDKVCRRMVKMYPEMVTSARNNLAETPLFLAVCHGKKNAFFVLEAAIHEEQNRTIDEHCLSRRHITHCIGQGGNNILHYAIKGERFDLAYDIIQLYPPLVNYVNLSGETALHTLANKPSVFNSGARFGLYDTIIYHCTTTKPLQFQFDDFLKNEKIRPKKKNASEEPSDIQEDEKKLLPRTYKACIGLFSLMKDSISCIFNTVGLRRLQKITELEQKHRNANTIMEKLVDNSTLWEYEETSGGKKPDGGTPLSSDNELISRPLTTSGHAAEPGLDDKTQKPIKDETGLSKVIKELGIDKLNDVLEKGSLKIVEESTNVPYNESPVLVAAKKGITEMVKRILKKYPVAFMDKDKDAKNIVLLAVEHRQVNVYNYMLNVPIMESVSRNVDREGNSALHLAAKLNHNSLWSTGSALHIQWEINWYKYVHHTTILDMFTTINKDGKTPEEVFIESHDTLVKAGITGLTNTCQSCSVVATLFATVAFQSVSTVPGGVDQQSGYPILSKRPAFQLFAISSLIALCFSVTSVVMFLAILISNLKVWDFERRLPVKLILGLTTLFMAIASTLVAFCAGDFLVLENNLKFAAYPIYAIMCFPVTYFAVAQFPLYINLIKLTIKKIPEAEGMLDY